MERCNNTMLQREQVRNRQRRFAVMALRLLITTIRPPHSPLERGLIPVIAHWDLAAFIYLAAHTPTKLSRIPLLFRAHPVIDFFSMHRYIPRCIYPELHLIAIHAYDRDFLRLARLFRRRCPRLAS